MKIIVFGDSIAYGKRDSHWGRVARLRERIDQSHNLGDTCQNAQVYNLSIPGETALRISKRFKSELAMRVVDPNPETKVYVILALGINDSCEAPWIQWEKTPLDKFTRAIEEMIDYSLEKRYEVVVLWLTPVDEKKLSWKWTNQEIQKYDTVLATSATKYNVSYLPLFTMFQIQELVSSMSDGIHPDSSGHEKIFQVVKSSLEWIGIA